MPLGVGIALHHLFSRVDSTQADEFFQAFIDKVEGSPATVLRLALDDMAQQGGRRVQTTTLALSIKAWNAFTEGHGLRLVRFNPGREKFPDILGLEVADQAELQPTTIVTARNDSDNGAIDVDVVEITPERARELLGNNPGNRIVAPGVVAKYRRDMTARRWLLNGQTIKIGKSGRLLDGQHRLHACVQSEVSFPAIVVQNLDEGVFDTFDLGGRRAFAEILKQRGEKSTAALAAALRWLWMVEEKKIFDRVQAPTNSELDNILSRHNGIIESLKLSNRIRHVMAPAMGIALHYLFSRKNANAAEEFFERIVDGQNLTKDMPVWHIRERLLNDRLSRKVKLAESERFVLTVKAWNAYRQDKKVAQLSWRGKGPSREALPEIL
ncbi:hypothetical protein [Lichenicoccus sp.]|uniref:hypothetical protein n=1 Tax=Lichenicoccus sp. TaxID=2781899 RepID=UPI003D0A83AB